MFEKDLSDPVGGGIVTYAVDGKQYVAVAAGMDNPTMQAKSGPRFIAIFALP